MPPTRREQLQLDELLSDIYRGIETLPDKSAQGNNFTTSASNKSSSGAGISSGISSSNNNNGIYSRTHVKEYELPASSPLVQRHKREIAALRSQQQASNYSPIAQTATATTHSSAHNHKQPGRSTLKRQTPDSAQPQQSLASYITSSATPENRRRVRIVDHPDKVAKGGYSSDDYDDNEVDFEQQQQQAKQARGSKRGKVKYVNTNKLIYHQERNPDDQLSESDEGANQNHRAPVATGDDDDDDIDGVSRVEYYHTTWLDRQLGRASKRRSSKELTERQVKEKAMIEELKRSLKNGAITLKQSFRGNKNKNKSSELFDDHAMLSNSGSNNNSNYNSNRNNRYKESTVIGSGLATIPRNYNSHQERVNNKYNEFDSVYRVVDEDNNSFVDSKHKNQPAYTYKLNEVLQERKATPKQTSANTIPNSYSSSTAPRGGYTGAKSTLNASTPATVEPSIQAAARKENPPATNYSRTLPHNYHQSPKHHQLLHSHYKGNTLTTSAAPSANRSRDFSQNNPAVAPAPAPAPANADSNSMRNPNYTNNCVNTTTNTSGSIKSPSQYTYNQQLMNVNPPRPGGETISSIPSATEVVRSALSRSGSQVSLNQLNKTINLLPNSPPPYGSSPMTPTQNLKAASPSLSPSPVGSRQICPSPHFSSKTLGSPHGYQPQQQPLLPGMTRVTGTRTIERMPTQSQPHQHQQQQQQVYANPHASLMQLRQEQQMRQPNKNQASIREFNELDSLLRSLGPGSTTHVSPAFSSRPAQAAFGGYGYNPVQQQQQQPAAPANQNKPTDTYARVQKNPLQQVQEQARANYGPNAGAAQPYTIDVTEKKDDDCLRRQNVSEFEPPMELLPSMEDYQNISKLNPVKNNYWYKPMMSRDRAINLLKDKPQGTFIVRDSTTFKGGFGLAVKVSKLPRNVMENASLRNPGGDPAAELIRHFLIEQTVEGVRLKGYSNEPVFSNLANLIYQHSLTEIALPCKLVIPRADIEDPKFNQKQKQYYDEFIASKEQAKHNPYERTSPNGGYRKYPGDVYVHNEHRIIFE